MVVVSLIIFDQQKVNSKPNKKSSERNLKNDNNDRNERRLPNNEEKDDNDDPSIENQGFIEKRYLDNKGIQGLKHWGLEVKNVPDLKENKRRGAINTLSVDSQNKQKGSVSQLVIILKPSSDVLSADLRLMKINQSQNFADTRSYNEAVIRFAINKLIEQGSNWKYDVYVLKTNSGASIISSPSAGTGVYVALLSSFYSDFLIPKNLVIAGTLETDKKEIPHQIEPVSKKFRWQADHCTQCDRRSDVYHFIYDK
ncbi:MAG: hypothetical protein MRERC_14c026 [Mycoplasmataceae bacterium RC_NB112A]|nr:MAG: hypothetical protein MRERC_14c026 [Mycoplasmataceae bacterium RC_NB112A]